MSNLLSVSVPSSTAGPWKSVQGRWMVKELFYEERHFIRSSPTADEDNCIYTLKMNDIVRNGKVYLSLGKLFVDLGDETEYLFANTYLGGWDHWKAMQDNAVLKDPIAAWREELPVKIKAEALARIKLEASDPANKNYYAANRFLVGDATESRRQKAGRKSKEEILSVANRIAVVKQRDSKEVSDDLSRIIEFRQKVE